MRVAVFLIFIIIPLSGYGQPLNKPPVNIANTSVDADSDVRRQVAVQILNAWSNEDFGTLESMANEYLNPTKRTPSGWRLLSLYQDYLSESIAIRSKAKSLEMLTAGATADDKELDGPEPSRYAAVNAEWDKVGSKIKRWREKFNNSPSSVLAMAMYDMNRGYYFRGTQYSAVVNEEAWPIFQNNYDAAGALLAKNKTIRLKNPIWFSLMLDVLGTQSVSRAGIEALALDTLDNGQGYLSAILSAFKFVQPRWGGSYERMEEFAKLADQKSFKYEHGEVYARLYWNLVAIQHDEMDLWFFSRTNANWPMLSHSFDIMIQHHPQPRNLSGYALFACMVGDTAKANELLTRAQTKTYIKFWPRELQDRCVPK